MAENTKIQWAHHTFNPWRGCTKIADGCRFCYADALSKRNPTLLGVWGDNGTRVIASESMWVEPRKWERRAVAANHRLRVFCASLADVFEDREELLAPRKRLFELIDSTPNLDWLLVTKRPENIRSMWPATMFDHTTGFDDHGDGYRKNVWLLTSVATQADANRNVPLLKACRPLSPVLGISAEPLLGPIDFVDVGGLASTDGFVFEGPLIGPVHLDDGADTLDWIIVGGESGPHARRCEQQWILDILEQCGDSSTPCFVKQLGSTSDVLHLMDLKGGNMDEWPVDLRVREFPGDRCQ